MTTTADLHNMAASRPDLISSHDPGRPYFAVAGREMGTGPYVFGGGPWVALAATNDFEAFVAHFTRLRAELAGKIHFLAERRVRDPDDDTVERATVLFRD